MRIIDMHVHTSASDGSYSPSGVVRLGEKVGLQAIAVTDHDTVSGIAEAVCAAENSDIEVIPGIEISVGETGNTHILGFYIDPKNPGLAQAVETLQQGRRKRNIEMLRRLNSEGFSAELSDIEKFAQTDNVGRPHIAQYMVKTGQTADYGQFFRKYLSEGAPCYVHRETLSEEDGIRAITEAGGLPFLAHITYFNKPYSEIEQILKRLIGFGLRGLECYYSNYTKEDEAFCLEMCEKYGLLKSGGTDFHGSRRKGVYLGTRRGNMCVSSELLIPIKKEL